MRSLLRTACRSLTLDVHLRPLCLEEMPMLAIAVIAVVLLHVCCSRINGSGIGTGRYAFMQGKTSVLLLNAATRPGSQAGDLLMHSTVLSRSDVGMFAIARSVVVRGGLEDQGRQHLCSWGAHSIGSSSPYGNIHGHVRSSARGSRQHDVVDALQLMLWCMYKVGVRGFKLARGCFTPKHALTSLERRDCFCLRPAGTFDWFILHF